LTLTDRKYATDNITKIQKYKERELKQSAYDVSLKLANVLYKRILFNTFRSSKYTAQSFIIVLLFISISSLHQFNTLNNFNG